MPHPTDPSPNTEELTVALGVPPAGYTETGAPIYDVPSWQLDRILGHIPNRHLLAISVNEVHERRLAAEHAFVQAAIRVCPTPVYDAVVAAMSYEPAR